MSASRGSRTGKVSLHLSAWAVGILAAVGWLVLDPHQALGQAPCALNNQNGIATLSVLRTTAGPAHTAEVPRIDTPAICRIHLTPRAGVSSVRLTLSITVSPSGPAGGAAKGVVQVTSPDSSQLRVVGNGATLEAGRPMTLEVETQVLSAAAREYPLWLELPDTLGGVQRLPFRLLWAPQVQLSIVTSRTGCGAELCLFQGVPATINLSGADPEIDLGIRVRATPLPSGQELPDCCDIVRTEQGSSFRLPGLPTSTTRLIVSVPLTVARIEGGTRTTTLHVDTMSVALDVPRAQSATITYADIPQQTELQVLRGASRGIRVRLSLDDGTIRANNEGLSFTNGGKYQFRELVMGQTGAPVAELFVEDAGQTVTTGTLLPLLPTQQRSGRDGAPRLSVAMNQGALTTELTVLPPTRIDRFVVLHPGGGEEVNGSLQPSQKYQLRLEGPGVGHLVSGTFGRWEVKPVRTGRDSVEVAIQVHREARGPILLTLYDVDGAPVTVPVTVVQARRQRTDIGNFARLTYRDGSERRELAFTDSVTPASTLSQISLATNPGGIDSEEAVFGVQYLEVKTELFDAAGNARGSDTRCLAIVPPPVGDRPYTVEGTCTPILGGNVELSTLIEPTRRATAGSTLRITVRHDPGRYPGSPPSRPHVASLKRRGRFVVEPRAQLPGPVMNWKRGVGTPGLTYTGALVSIQPLLGDYGIGNNAHAFNAQGGVLLSSTPVSDGGDALNARLALTAGLGYIFRNMLGDLALDFFVGHVWPVSRHGLRARDAYWIIRPGFSIPIGGGGTK